MHLYAGSGAFHANANDQLKQLKAKCSQVETISFNHSINHNF